MPGILFHLAFAHQVYRKLNSPQSFDEITFLAGNLIPDLSTTDKQKSHYRTAGSLPGFVVPNMLLAKQDLLVPEDPIKLGLYAHLYLDYHFIENFLIPSFIWDEKTMMIINPKSNRQWDVETFFSCSGMYGGYTEINQLLLRDHYVPIAIVQKIPQVLPPTGLPIFDIGRNKKWRDDWEKYLALDKEYTGEIFDYAELWSFIQKKATQLAKDLSK